jgi:Phosphotransferase enzyme family
MKNIDQLHLLTPFFGENFKIFDKNTPQTTHFYFISDAAGSMRWVFPVGCKLETLLSLYNSAGWRGRLRILVYRFTFALKRQIWISSGEFWAVLEEKNEDFALFTGTPGRNRKMVVSCSGNYFEKIPLTAESATLVQRELEILEKLSKLNLQKVVVPIGQKSARNFLLQNNVRPTDVIPTTQLTPRHLAALQELSNKTSQNKALKDTFFYKKIKENIAAFEQCATNEFTQKATPLFAKINAKLAGLETQNAVLSVTLAHGDFTPWNCFLPAETSQSLAIYDWELALDDAPQGFDALHYTVQSGILLRRLSLEQLSKEAHEIAQKTTQNADLLPLYVIFTAAYYLPLYARQEDLHAQVWWLLEAWEALI